MDFMEIISSPWMLAGSFVPVIAYAVHRALRDRAVGEIAQRDLACPATRLDLQQLLAKANVVGSADIRDSRVFPAPDLDAGHPVLRVAASAVADFYRRTPNSNAQALYWRNPSTGGYEFFGEFDVECASDVVGLLSRRDAA